jgi:hypothetical protein
VAPTVAKSPEPTDIGTAVGVILGGTALVIVSLATLPVTLPLAVGYTGGARVHDQPSLESQEKIELNMDGADVARVMGQPTATFYLDPVHNEVRYFERLIAPALWIGLDGDRVAWLRFDYRDQWLNAVTERLREAEYGSPPTDTARE